MRISPTDLRGAEDNESGYARGSRKIFKPEDAARSLERGRGGVVVELPAARYLDSHVIAPAEAARKPAAKWHQVFCYGSGARIDKGSGMANQSDQRNS